MSKKIRNVDIPILARVEGEGALHLRIQKGELELVQLKIFEPPRLFEKFLEGRFYHEVLDIVARICGICPVAYQMSAAQAIEHCFGLSISPWVRQMRRLFYCGEWLESHGLHMHFLAAPDFLGFQSATEMAKSYPEELKRGLRLQAFGNELVRLLGGRSVHPVGACVGGFYKAPDVSAIENMLKKAQERIQDCRNLLRWVCSFNFPKHHEDITCVSLRHEQEYPMNEGRIVSNKGLNIAIEEFEQHFREFQQPYSNALHCLLKGKSYLVGPLARLNNNYDHLPSEITAFLQELKFNLPTLNMHHSIVARAIEIYLCVLEASRILASYQLPQQAKIPFTPGSGKGFGCTEAPRGLLWHQYHINKEQKVIFAQIVPPTSQNQARIEEDLRFSLKQFGLNKKDDELRLFSERVIRNYDPCISCSTHFLTLNVSRE
ncbi:Ni/Fe hydrogenase subunit alpha [Legionella jordanis]|uniref:Ni/Fe hydrogenase subunit alpha n=1 Tax=Legionella jordanis TaxID=456 RepID=UPI000EFF455C|nr:Ni/Fe hydrogenase subunit alpha [Legionella jordanis]RMX15125.1 Ni/Fe hydrogenase subunit alpha [Legionella jordanis]HAT8714865.1 Ni/Fe hydrogenase subunit alpha [Legionella jordanis]